MEENFDQQATDLEALLKDRLLVAGNVESMTMTSVTYLLKGDPTCRPLPSEIADGEMDRVRVGCAADLAKLQVRIVVTKRRRRLPLPDPDRPEQDRASVFVIHSDLLAWEVDLAMARMATDYINTQLMSGRRAGRSPSPSPSCRAGSRSRLQKLGEKKASLGWSVLEALDIQGKSDAPFALAMAKADPAFSVTGDGEAKTITIKLAFPQTDLRGPWDPKDTGVQNSDLHVSIGGLFGQSTLSEAAKELAFTGLGMGAVVRRGATG